MSRSPALNYFHFIRWLAFFQGQYEFDLFALNEVLFGLTAQFAEIRRLKKKPQGFQLLGKLSIFALVEKLTHNPLVLSFCLCFHAGIQLRLQFYAGILTIYLPHPLYPL